MLLKAGSDEKYQVVKKVTETIKGKNVTTYIKLDDAEAFMGAEGVTPTNALSGKADRDRVTVGSVTKYAEDFKEAYTVSINANPTTGKKVEYILVNTSGKIIDKKGKSKDGNDYYYVTGTNGTILGLYVED